MMTQKNKIYESTLYPGFFYKFDLREDAYLLYYNTATSYMWWTVESLPRYEHEYLMRIVSKLECALRGVPYDV